MGEQDLAGRGVLLRDHQPSCAARMDDCKLLDHAKSGHDLFEGAKVGIELFPLLKVRYPGVGNASRSFRVAGEGELLKRKYHASIQSPQRILLRAYSLFIVFLGKVRREKFGERIGVETAGHDGAAQADQSKLLFMDVSFPEVRKVAGTIEPGGVADGCGQQSGQGVGGKRLGFHWMAPFSRAFCSIARNWGTIFSSDFRCRSNSRQPTKSVLAGAGTL